MTRVVREPWLGGHVLSYPDRLPTILDALDHAVHRFGDRRAVVDRSRSVTYAELADLVEGAAARLREAGTEPGDRVAVAADNTLELAVGIFACARAGLIMAGLNPRLGSHQWAQQLATLRPRVALATEAHRPALAAALSQAGLDVDGPGEAEGTLAATASRWAFTEAQRPGEADCYQVVFSSGTTGTPKAIAVVHRASMHSAHSYQRLLGFGPDDRTAVVFPLSYISGLHAHVLPIMLAGGCSVLLPTPDPAGYLATLRRHQITWAYAAPAFWQLLLRRRAFASETAAEVRLAAFGGAPMPNHAVAELRRRMPQARLHNIYGLSETHSPATMLFDDEMSERQGAAGRPLPCMEARTVDEQGRDAGGAPGELWLRGSLVTSGYLDDPAATAAAVTPDGWLRTGDIARIDAGGYVWVLDRAKDVIDRGGHTVYSAEVERVLQAHPGVADAAVVGVPGAFGGEAVACMVEPADGMAPTPAELRRWVTQRYGRVAAPRFVELVEELPRTASGKPAKGQLRQRFADRLA